MQTEPMTLPETLRSYGACITERELAGLTDRKSPREAWEACDRGDWLLWLAARAGVDRRLVVRAACRCARQALVHVPADEKRPLHAIEMAEAWTRGEATIEEVSAAAAAAAAYGAADAAYAYAAAAAAAAYARSLSLATCADIVRSVIPFAVMLDAVSGEVPHD